MSDQAPPTPNTDSSISAKFALRKQQDRRASRRTIVISVLIHVVILVAIFFLTPWQKLVDEVMALESSAPKMISAMEVERLDEKIEEINARKLRATIEELRAVQQELEQVELKELQQFEPFQEQQAQLAPQQAVEAAEGAIEAMQRAQAALATGNANLAREEQAKAEQLQSTAQDRLNLLPAEAIAAALDAQETATQTQRASSDSRAESEKLAGDIGSHVQEVAREERQLKQLENQLGMFRNQLNKTQSGLDQRKNSLRIQEGKKASEKQIEQTKRQILESEKHVEVAQQRLDKQQQAVDQKSEELYALKQQADQPNVAADEKLADAAKLQDNALDQQKNVLSLLTTALADTDLDTESQTTSPGAESQVASSENASTPSTQSPATQPIDNRDLAGKSLAELYDLAENAERKLTDAFENIRAMELAVIRNSSLAQARLAVDDVTPIRDGIDRQALAQNAQTGQGLREKREAVAQAIQETQSMVELAQLLQHQINQESDGEGVGRLALALAAASESSEAGQAEQKSDSVNGNENMATSLPTPAAVGPMPPAKFSASLGRRIASTGDSTDWIALDIWYIIGPWENEGRRNLSRQFPPESIVDLDAAYFGKRGETIRWNYVKTNQPQGRIGPPNAEPYGIWYGFTEINLETAQTLWVAIGSDDRGTLWVNGQQVWVSSPEHKVWNPGEARIPVEFKAGQNKILVRCENGQSIMGFSVAIKLSENASAD